MKIKLGIYKSKSDPSLGLFLITKGAGGGYIILSCNESGYPNSAAGSFNSKYISDYEFVKELNKEENKNG